MVRKGSLARRFAGQRGQLVIPALFVIPTLVLFIYLIFDTAKVSREKIRRQFALDTAAFVEMTNYSNFLNRTAYVNGAFPQRVLYEAFSSSDFNIPGRDGNPEVNMYRYMRDAGMIPYTDQCENQTSCLAALGQASNRNWNFKYRDPPDPKLGNTLVKNRNAYAPGDQDLLDIFPPQFALKAYIGIEMGSAIYKLYAQVFGLLGSVQQAQRDVFSRLTTGHAFFMKAYTLNTGDKPDAQDQLPTLTAGEAYVKKFTFSAVVPEGQEVNVHTLPPQAFPGSGMFILGFVKSGNGWVGGDKQNFPPKEIRQTWLPDPNYFGVDLKGLLGYRPYVHVTVEVSGGKVWPGATPRYQTKIYP